MTFPSAATFSTAFRGLGPLPTSTIVAPSLALVTSPSPRSRSNLAFLLSFTSSIIRFGFGRLARASNFRVFFSHLLMYLSLAFIARRITASCSNWVAGVEERESVLARFGDELDRCLIMLVIETG